MFLKKEQDISIDELRHVVEVSRESGIVQPQESDLIEGSLDLQQSTARERMRPRDEILYYDIQEPLSKLLHLFVDLATTRVPVCDGDLEKMLGIISTETFFFERAKIHKGEDLVPILKKPRFVPEMINAWTLLQELRSDEESLALVVDEYGSISGLITQEDLIEVVVGEINDLRDAQDLYTRSGAGVIIANGKLDLATFKEIFGVALKSKENTVTLGGWLTEELGDIPKVGTKYEKGPFLFYVLAAEPNRVRRIYVRYLKRGI
jgi:CBS domain containing-hemolysin-like protein